MTRQAGSFADQAGHVQVRAVEHGAPPGAVVGGRGHLVRQHVGDVHRAADVELAAAGRRRVVMERHRLDDHRRQAPDAKQVGADLGVRRAELRALEQRQRQAFAHRLRGDAAVGVGEAVRQHQLARVVKQTRDERLVALLLRAPPSATRSARSKARAAASATARSQRNRRARRRPRTPPTPAPGAARCSCPAASPPARRWRSAIRWRCARRRTPSSPAATAWPTCRCRARPPTRPPSDRRADRAAWSAAPDTAPAPPAGRPHRRPRRGSPAARGARARCTRAPASRAGRARRTAWPGTGGRPRPAGRRCRGRPAR